jgi:hypothetical protein
VPGLGTVGAGVVDLAEGNADERIEIHTSSLASIAWKSPFPSSSRYQTWFASLVDTFAKPLSDTPFARLE